MRDLNLPNLANEVLQPSWNFNYSNDARLTDQVKNFAAQSTHYGHAEHGQLTYSHCSRTDLTTLLLGRLSPLSG